MKVQWRRGNTMKIPLVDLKRQYLSIKREIDGAIADVLDCGQFIMGENVERFDREFAKYVGVKQAIGVASGTDALMLALIALGIRTGDEVITVSFTFVSSVDCIVHNAATPVFVDVDPETCTMNVCQVERMITKKTKAVIPVHLYGHPVDMDPLLEVAHERGVRIIEDAAQAHGAEYRERKVGSFGDVACFSFYPSKNLGAYGDAGMVVTSDEDIAEKLRMLHEYGQKEKYHHEMVGYNSRIDEMQAAILRVKLKFLDKWNEMRRNNAKKYEEMLSGLSEVQLPIEKDYVKDVYHLYVIRAKHRNELREQLALNGISTGIHYPIPVHLQKAYAHLGLVRDSLPVTEIASQEVLSLPMFPELTAEEIEYVCYNIEEFYKK